MSQRRGSSQQSVSNLSVSFIESAFLMLVGNSLPVYRHNIARQRPPVAAGENVSAAAAVMLLITGLDYHLCRLKYLRDIYKHTPPLPNTPYFNWSFSEALPTKLQRLLTRPKETLLLKQLIEMTVCRDAIVHPKFYTITRSWNADFEDSTIRAKLPPGTTHWPKAMKNKMQRREFSRVLKLPLVPTWVSYIDAVVCILVLHRLLSLLEWRYGNPYGWVGGITAYQDQTKDLFTAWNWQQSHPRELKDWVRAFYQSLSVTHQRKVEQRLGGNIELYVQKKHRNIPMKTSKVRVLGRIFLEKTAAKPDFLFKAPPSMAPRTKAENTRA